jgi:hypothetical protein
MRIGVVGTRLHVVITVTRLFPSAKTSNPKVFPKQDNQTNNSMEQSLEAANPSSATQEIPIVLWNPNGISAFTRIRHYPHLEPY